MPRFFDGKIVCLSLAKKKYTPSVGIEAWLKGTS